MSGDPRPIGVVAPYLGGYYYGAMFNGIQQIAQEQGIPLLVILDSLENQTIPALGNEHVAGWIALHANTSDLGQLTALGEGGRPVVTLPVPVQGAICTTVQVDNRGGMCQAVLHLIDHGHQRIAFVDHGNHSWSKQRYLGYCDALEQRGIPQDPTLIMCAELDEVDGVQAHAKRGELAAQQLLAHGMPCTALVAATDTSALAAMQAFQTAGLRIPEDLAIIGFDDISEAQYANPPLTSIRCKFDAIGRAAAEQMIVEIRGGRSSYPQMISVQTSVIHRRSCGCAGIEQLLAGAQGSPGDADQWEVRLARELVQLLHYPLPIDPAMAPLHLWPEVTVLVAAVDAVLRDREPPAAASIAAAWSRAIVQTDNVEILHTIVTHIEDTIERQLGPTHNASQRSAVVTLIREIRLELLRARTASEIVQKQRLSEQIISNFAVSSAIFSSEEGLTKSLDWLASTNASWGCLGLWEDRSGAGTRNLAIVGVYDRYRSAGLEPGQLLPVTAFPPMAQLPESVRQGADLVIICPVRTTAREWGVLALCGWSGRLQTMESEKLTVQANLLAITLERDHAHTVLTEQQQTLQEAFRREQMLSQTIREMGCPIIPLLSGVLLVPLIGSIDSMRAQQIIDEVLSAVARHRADTVLLDMTGVPLVDTQVASSLLQAAQAVQLLGARIIMVGIRPEIAQSIVGLGIDLRQLRIYATLASAVATLQVRSRAY